MENSCRRGWHEIVYSKVMTAAEKFNTVKRACIELKICQLIFGNEKSPRFIRPLGICLTFNRGLVIVCRLENTTEINGGNEAPVSNLPIEDCHMIKITDRKFKVVPEFFKKTHGCDDWLFHVGQPGS